MTYKGHKIVFGGCRRITISYVSDMYDTDAREQRWDVPSLELHGYVVIEKDGIPCELKFIQTDIFNEIEFDLEQRRKRALGIHC